VLNAPVRKYASNCLSAGLDGRQRLPLVGFSLGWRGFLMRGSIFEHVEQVA
jgi:hypothetical protein